MYCPYCNVEHPDGTELSVEHIIPYSIGGSNALTITTCRKSNSDLGSAVDAPFIDFFPVRAKRFSFALQSTGGHQPTLDLGGMGYVDGRERHISHRIAGNSRELKIAAPLVEETNGDGENKKLRLSGDYESVKRILLGKIRKEKERGALVTMDDGTILSEENLDRMIRPLLLTITNPSVTMKIDFDPLMPIRFFSKLALAMGHYHLGEEFSRSSYAEIVRAHMHIKLAEDLALPGAVFWPLAQEIQPLLDLLSKEDCHTAAIFGSSPHLIVNLFGEFGAMIPIGPESSVETCHLTGDEAVWRIGLPSRKLERLTLAELYRQRALAAGCKL